MLMVIALAQLIPAVAVAPGEMDEARQWIAAKFLGVDATAEPKADTIEVLANHGVVQPNARAGKPLNLAGKPYARGLYCHAPSKLVVRLAQPGKTFRAMLGVDSNDQTSGGRGSVVFIVRVGDREALRSEVVREGLPAIPAAVDLGGATEFCLEVTDGGDGIACDQADWADARVELEDGTELWLGDLPLDHNEGRKPYDTRPFFSFEYDGRTSADLLASWETRRASRQLDAARTEHTLTYTDPDTGLVVRCVGVAYDGFPTVEWTLYFQNTGAIDSPILSSIQAIDTRLERGPAAEFVLHYHRGDDCTAHSYEPHADALAPETARAFACVGGRPTNGAFPYFNIARPRGGAIVALGWPGQWAAHFDRDVATGLQLRAGQERTHFRLHPGETIRTPLMVLQFYGGDWLRGQNIWRRWMVEHNLPRPGGKPMKPQIALCNGNHYPALMTNAAQEKAFIQRFVEEGIHVDYWWQDAGWYPCDGVGWPKVGTWEVDPVRFPKGLREVGDFARGHGIKTLVWFEPERVHADTWLAEKHPEWILGGGQGGLLDLGNPEARRWLTDHIDALITEQGIDFYRQDFNLDPLPYWRANDTEDRQGITEIRHVEGYLAYWDELRRRHPDMPIDSCASGGRRNDLETLRRAVPLLRSDWYSAPTGQQCHTYGLALWMPFNGTGFIPEKDEYWIRSLMVAEFTVGPGTEGTDVIDFEQMRRHVGQWRRIADCFLGDFHPLTPYTHAEDQWMAWQFDRPDLGEGVVQAFRRAESDYVTACFQLEGLIPDAVYTIVDFDNPGQTKQTGRELMEEGLTITLDHKPKAGIFTYKAARVGRQGEPD